MALDLSDNAKLSLRTVITTAIKVWNIRLTGSTRPSCLAIDLTSSVSPPPFKITDDPNPENKPSFKHPPVTRMIPPPPIPYIQTLRNPRLPVLTFRPGLPPAPCIINCGRPCLLFYNKPCLSGCSPGTAFPNPIDPNPPLNPNKDPTTTVKSRSRNAPPSLHHPVESIATQRPRLAAPIAQRLPGVRLLTSRIPITDELQAKLMEETLTRVQMR